MIRKTSIFLLVLLFLVMLAATLKAQPAKQYVSYFTPIESSCKAKADKLALDIFNAYVSHDTKGINHITSTMDTSWFYGYSLFVNETEDKVVEDMKASDSFYFKLPETKSAIVSMVADEQSVLVLVISLKSPTSCKPAVQIP